MPYLKNFILLSFPVPTAIFSSITTKELLDIMNKERVNAYNSGLRRSIPVELEICEGNKFINPDHLTLDKKASALRGNKLEFFSLSSCIIYLRSLGLFIKRDTLSRYIKLGKFFHNFSCKYL